MATNKPVIPTQGKPLEAMLKPGLGLPEANALKVDDNLLKEQTLDASNALKKILLDMETKEGIERLKKGSLDFKIKPGPGVLWYVAYGT